MTIKINCDGVQIPVEQIKFSDGGSNFRINWPIVQPERYVNISVAPSTPVDAVLFEVLIARDYIRDRLKDGVFWELDKNGVKLGLHLPYMPHARADRRFENSNPTPLHTFLGVLVPLFDVVYVTDPHSEVVEELVTGAGRALSMRSQFDCFKETNVPVDEVTLLIGPDEGSREKLKDFTGHRVIYASKVRDVQTGRVVSPEVPHSLDLTGIRCVIVDDIADGGGTFIPLANALRAKGCTEVELYVTHGIFAKGLEPFRGLINKIHVYQIVSNYISRADLDAFNSTEYV